MPRRQPTALDEAAGLIRSHLWLHPKTPPRSPDRNPWSMARELNIWKRLVKAGFRPPDVNGAITVVRTLRTDWASEALKMTVFYWRTTDGFSSTPFLETCIGYYHKNVDREQRWRAAMPPTTHELLRRVVDG